MLTERIQRQYPGRIVEKTMIRWVLKGFAIFYVYKSIAGMTGSAMLYEKRGDFSEASQHNLKPWSSKLSPFCIK